MCVQDWMTSNRLKLNPDKTEFLLMGSSSQRDKVKHSFPVDILGNSLSSAGQARNLGVAFDAELNYQAQIKSVVKSCNYYTRDIRRIRHLLDFDSAITLANALVSSRLDYCNSLMYAVPAVYLDKLQRVQNSLARVVTLSPYLTSSALLRKQLHWLPIRSRIHFKLAVITYKALNLHQPSSLSGLLQPVTHRFPIRSHGGADGRQLAFLGNSKSYGRKAFSFVAPKIWNAIPAQVRSASSLAHFRKFIETYYFTHPPTPP